MSYGWSLLLTFVENEENSQANLAGTWQEEHNRIHHSCDIIQQCVHLVNQRCSSLHFSFRSYKTNKIMIPLLILNPFG